MGISPPHLQKLIKQQFLMFQFCQKVEPFADILIYRDRLDLVAWLGQANFSVGGDFRPSHILFPLLFNSTWPHFQPKIEFFEMDVQLSCWRYVCPK